MSVMHLDVYIKDLNDNSPCFPAPSIEINVSEDLEVNHEIRLDRYKAADVDLGLFMLCPYSSITFWSGFFVIHLFVQFHDLSCKVILMFWLIFVTFSAKGNNSMIQYTLLHHDVFFKVRQYRDPVGHEHLSLVVSHILGKSLESFDFPDSIEISFFLALEPRNCLTLTILPTIISQ